MSYREAIEDGIPIKSSAGHFSQGGYYPPCHYCGQPVYSWAYQRGVKYTCPECRETVIRLKREDTTEIATNDKLKRLNHAIKRVSAITDIKLYEKAIAFIRNHIDRPGWFQSTEEIMVAMELIRCHVKAHHQVKVYEYRVDFVLEDMKVILEIDGPIYHGKDKERYQQIRDDAIQRKFGEGWEVIRIKTDCINMNITKLLPGIRAVLEKRKKNAHQFT
nr:MAG TPA: Very-short-patch-repair endonuclease [Caudoviricetes sp.]